MMKAIKGLLESRKAMMAFISAIVWAVGKAGLEYDSETLYPIVAPLWAYIAAQAGADFGKEGKKIEVDAEGATLDRLDAAAPEADSGE
jgi:hypothetical protein